MHTCTPTRFLFKGLQYCNWPKFGQWNFHCTLPWGEGLLARQASRLFTPSGQCKALKNLLTPPKRAKNTLLWRCLGFFSSNNISRKTHYDTPFPPQHENFFFQVGGPPRTPLGGGEALPVAFLMACKMASWWASYFTWGPLSKILTDTPRSLTFLAPLLA